ncbi:hypothetical protein PSTT_16554, partial [Puccinia striiformis]
VLFFGDTNTVGIDISNPLRVLKTTTSAWTLCSSPAHPCHFTISEDCGRRYRFLFAGAAAPIIGLAFIDSVFFATHGKCIHSVRKVQACKHISLSLFFQFIWNTFELDWEQPNDLRYVFTSGAITGGFCALLQTSLALLLSICSGNQANSEKGNQVHQVPRSGRASEPEMDPNLALSHSLARFTTGTVFRDALIQGGLREPYSQTMFALTESGGSLTTSASQSPEILVIMAAGGTSGMISALLPYPLNIIKTRLQVTKAVEAHPNNRIRLETLI